MALQGELFGAVAQDSGEGQHPDDTIVIHELRVLLDSRGVDVAETHGSSEDGSQEGGC